MTLNQQVVLYGLHTLYSILDSSGHMRILLVHAHLFDLKGVVFELNSRMINLLVAFVLDQNGNKSSQESPEFITKL